MAAKPVQCRCRVDREDKASGTQLIQELIIEGCHAVTKYKILRLHAQTGIIESGFGYILQTAPWLAAYLHEMTVFPKGEHDDRGSSGQRTSSPGRYTRRAVG